MVPRISSPRFSKAIMKDLGKRPVLAECPDYERENVRAALQAALTNIGGLEWVKPGMKIGVKLNLCSA